MIMLSKLKRTHYAQEGFIILSDKVGFICAAINAAEVIKENIRFFRDPLHDT